MTSEAYRWLLCEDFRFTINQNCREHIVSSDRMYIDESISRWYGVGVTFLEVGLPYYFYLDRKPESGCELQTISDGAKVIMLGLEFVKSEADRNINGRDKDMNHERCCQYDRDLEKPIDKEWSFRLNSTLLSVCFVYARLLYNSGIGAFDCQKSNRFYSCLEYELIAKQFDTEGFCRIAVPDDGPRHLGCRSWCSK